MTMDTGASKERAALARPARCRALRQAWLGGTGAAMLAASLAVGAAGLPAHVVIGSTAAAPAGSAPSSDGKDAPRVSPYALASRQHMLAASAPGSPPAVSRSMRRSRQAIGQLPREGT